MLARLPPRGLATPCLRWLAPTERGKLGAGWEERRAPPRWYLLEPTLLPSEDAEQDRRC